MGSDDDVELPEHDVLTAERETYHEQRARTLRAAADRSASAREAHLAFLTAEATATRAEADAASATMRLAQEDEQVDDDVVRLVADEANLASKTAARAHDAAASARSAAAVAATSTAPAPAPGGAEDAADDGGSLLLRGKQEANKLLGHADEAKTVADRQELLELAEVAYTRALASGGAHPERPVVHANRALCRLRLAMTYGAWSAPPKYREAIDDATEALAHQPSYPKASYRRARARLALACAPHATAGSEEQKAMLGGALADLRVVLDAEPNNAEARRWMEAAPHLSAQFKGRRLPERYSELLKEMARLDGLAGGAAPSRAADAVSHKAAQRAERRWQQWASAGLAAVVAILTVGYAATTQS